MIRNFRSPLSQEQLRPLETECRLLQFGEPMAEPELRKIASLAADHPGIGLRVYGQRTVPDLEFLELFPGLLRFTVEVFELGSIEGLRHLRSDLEHLGLGRTRSRAHSLALLDRFDSIRSLWVEGHHKDFDTVGTLESLERLSLRSLTLPDLSVLTGLDRLRSFELKLGGTMELSALPKIGAIEYLEIWQVRGLSDLSPIAELTSVRYLFLQSLKRVTRLPSFASLTNLRRAHIENLRELHDLGAVADAPNLEQLLLVDMPHLRPEAVQPFVGHPTLRAASVGLGSIARNEAARGLLGLPDVDTAEGQFGTSWWR